MQWMDDTSLTKAFVNPFDENGAFKGCETDFYTKSWIDEDRERVMKKYEDILIEKLGWNSPQMWLHQGRKVLPLVRRQVVPLLPRLEIAKNEVNP